MTLELFKKAAEDLNNSGIDLRTFILLKPPFTSELDADEWALRSLDFAFDCGSKVCTVIPTRAGNGAVDALERSGEFSPPRLQSLEAAIEYGLRMGRGRVFADVWDIERFYTCDCSPDRGQTWDNELHPANTTCHYLHILRMKADFDIAIIGSGLGGSLTAMVVRRLGYSVVLLERGSHPRFAIGESSSPMANLLLERIGLEYDLPRLLPLTTWGAWQAAYPEIGVG